MTIVLLSLMVVSAQARPTTRSEAVPSDDNLALSSPGVSGPIPYEKYGHFDGVGTADYHYVITNKKGLAAAAGEGIFPYAGVYKDPAYKALAQAKVLDGNQWKFVDGNMAAKNFYKWATTNEDPGVKQFYVALMLERAGLLKEAVKAFYAVAVHFPKTISYTYYDTPWYVGATSLDRIEQILRRHPELKMKLVGGRIAVKNRYDTDLKNDVFSIDPGKLVALKKPERPKKINVAKMAVIKTVGGDRFQLREYKNKHWQFFVDGKPFPIRAMTYSVTPIGHSPDRNNWDVSKDWQLVDTDNDKKHDGFDQSYIDTNHNNKRDDNEPVVGDGKIINDLGVNTLRAYHHLYNKDLFRRLYKENGIYVLCGDLLGGYAVGSGASWNDGTDYSNVTQQENMLKSVRDMVTEYKDEPYILMWVLGNENVYGVANNANTHPEDFFKLVNRAAELIHQLDPSRPVAIANGDLLDLDYIKRLGPAIDVMGANSYRGEQGFGRNLFQDAQDALDRPVRITEYGTSAYGEGYSQQQADAYQSMYLANNWEDLEANMAGHGVGNALGGVLFEYMDEWWKANSDLPEKVQKAKADWYAPKSATYKSLQPDKHDVVPQFGFPFLDGWSYEEWFGLISQGNGQDSPFCRQLRPSYFTMQDMWKTRR
jgi:beta-glucuronidase